MRFRPHENATSMKIRISLDIVPTSTDGALYVDSAVLRVIRPHMNWVNGSIVETAVSTGARSFQLGHFGQSLIADILEDGASGIKGYEPYQLRFPRRVYCYHLTLVDTTLLNPTLLQIP